MPRAKSPQQPTSNTNYANRTDLPGALPTAVVPSQQYGQQAAQVAAQKAVPMAPGPLPTPGPTPPPGPGGAGVPVTPPVAPGGPGPQVPPSPMPGELAPFGGQTMRPNEPVTHGIPSGPGAGPEVLAPPDPLLKTAAMLNQLGSTADPQTSRLRDIVNASLKNGAAE